MACIVLAWLRVHAPNLNAGQSLEVVIGDLLCLRSNSSGGRKLPTKQNLARI